MLRETPVHQAKPLDIVFSPAAPLRVSKRKTRRGEEFKYEPRKKSRHPPPLLECQAKEWESRRDNQDFQKPADTPARSFHALVEKNRALAIRLLYCARPDGAT